MFGGLISYSCNAVLLTFSFFKSRTSIYKTSKSRAPLIEDDTKPKAWPAWPFLAFLTGPRGTSFETQGSKESADAISFTSSTV